MREYYPVRLLVPRSLLQVPLEELALPPRMLRFARRCHARFLGHLDLMPEWQMTKQAGAKCFRDLQDWLDKVRLEQWRTEDALATSDLPLDELMRVPPAVRALPVSNPPLSTRLSRALQTYGMVTMGDLDGLRFRRVLSLCNVGPRSVHELREFLSRLTVSKEPGRYWAVPVPERAASSEPVDELDERLRIPDAVHDLPLSHFCLSHRLMTMLAKIECRRLGDLNGLSVRELFRTPGFGKLTFRELLRLARHAATGRFTPLISQAPLAVAELLQWMDQFVENLSDKDRQTVMLRFGAHGPPLSFDEIGSRLGRSGPTINARVKRALASVHHAFGPFRQHQFERGLEHLGQECERLGSPLNAALLRTWLGGAAVRHDLDFYVRLLIALAGERSRIAS